MQNILFTVKISTVIAAAKNQSYVNKGVRYIKGISLQQHVYYGLDLMFWAYHLSLDLPLGFEGGVLIACTSFWWPITGRPIVLLGQSICGTFQALPFQDLGWYNSWKVRRDCTRSASDLTQHKAGAGYVQAQLLPNCGGCIASKKGSIGRDSSLLSLTQLSLQWLEDSTHLFSTMQLPC